MIAEDTNTLRPDAMKALVGSVSRLEEYARVRGYEGIDPYDALASPFIRSLPGTLPRMAMTQLFVYSPVNLRRPFKVSPGRNPKAIALFLSSYGDMYRAGLITEEALNEAAKILSKHLIDSHIRGYHGYCWGINFDLQDTETTIHPGMPSIVPTYFAADAFLDLFEITDDHNYLDMAMSCCEFIVNDLNILETDGGICFSYRPNDNKAIHNANLLGAAILARAHFHGGEADFLDLARKAADFSVGHQESNGSWSYGIDPKTGHKRFQLDYHQGFIINSLYDFIRYSKLSNSSYEDALKKGVDFFRANQFDSQGRSMWRLPWRWPIDIHHQAQGIATFAKLWRQGEDFLPFSAKIALWTINNMQDQTGYFYHQKYPVGANKISYMRWSQAWMVYSLSHLIRCFKDSEKEG